MTSCLVTRSISSMRATSNVDVARLLPDRLRALLRDRRRSRRARRRRRPRSRTRCGSASAAPRSRPFRGGNSGGSSALPSRGQGRSIAARREYREPPQLPIAKATARRALELLAFFMELRRVSPQNIDVAVLGAGFVGVCAALHLQARGRSVVILDRLGEVAGETSFGNAGIVQSEAVFPYMFPRSASEILRAGVNRDPRALIRYSALPSIAPFLWRYFLASSPRGRQTSANAMRGLIELCLAEHRRSRRPQAPGRCCATAAGSRSSARRAAPIRGSPTPRRSGLTASPSTC